MTPDERAIRIARQRLRIKQRQTLFERLSRIEYAIYWAVLFLLLIGLAVSTFWP